MPDTAAGLQWETKAIAQHQGSRIVGHDFILTADDVAPEGATYAQDILELSMLTMPARSSAVDISWDKSPLDY
uniref:Uncharacterized protein n=1 Tax=Arthrobacter sp. J3.40 TaxID=347209 RepID=I3W151_9MICC|nr:hypothetical protein [Arthrobacter sp. J3.40]AFK89328.1 hypothetical protein [Arthrobacter sp. J3.40]